MTKKSIAAFVLAGLVILSGSAVVVLNTGTAEANVTPSADPFMKHLYTSDKGAVYEDLLDGSIIHLTPEFLTSTISPNALPADERTQVLSSGYVSVPRSDVTGRADDH